MGLRLVLAPGQLAKIRERFMPTLQKMGSVSQLILLQVNRRFETEGSSGGKPWPRPKFIAQIGRPDGRKLLEGRNGSVAKSYRPHTTENSAQVSSDNVAAAMAQAGTKGKGGDLPDIVPRRAKMLFIPVSERAKSSTPITRFGIKFRQANDGGKLIRGHIHNGKLSPPDADFILTHKSAIPQREQLPDSELERQKQTDVVVNTLMQ